MVARVATGCLTSASGVAAAVLLAVSAELLPHLRAQQPQAAAAAAPKSGARAPTNFAAPVAAARALHEPAARLQTAIRRGRGLCSSAPVRGAVAELLQAESCPVAELGYAKTSGVRMLLWRLLGCTFQDVCPYSPSDACCSIPELVGLAPGESIIKCPSPLNVLKDTYDHIYY
jgi:hypothetical protein